MRTVGRNLSPNQMLGLVCAGVFFASLDQTVVVTALPAMMLDLEISSSRIDEAAWVITGYLLGFTAAVPLSGRAGDIYGHRRVYQVGLLVIAMASTKAATAPSSSSACPVSVTCPTLITNGVVPTASRTRSATTAASPGTW